MSNDSKTGAFCAASSDGTAEESRATTTDRERRHCSSCRTEGLFLRCGGCRTTYYCGKECQKKDWSSGHKWFCPLTYPEKDSGLKEGSVRAVLLPADSSLAPRFVEVPYKLYEDEEEGNWTAPDNELFLGEECYYARRMAHCMGQKHSNVCKGSGDADDHMITVFFRDNFLNDGSKPNECVAAITKGANVACWRGPMLVFDSDYCQTIYSTNPQYVDFKKEYTNTIVEFFLEERNM